MSEVWVLMCVISELDPQCAPHPVSSYGSVTPHGPEHYFTRKRRKKKAWRREWGGKRCSGESPELFQQRRQSNSPVSRNNTHLQIFTPALIKMELNCRQVFQKFPALVCIKTHFGSVPVTPFKKKIFFSYDSFTTSRCWRKRNWKNRRTHLNWSVLLDWNMTDRTVGDALHSNFTCSFIAERRTAL